MSLLQNVPGGDTMGMHFVTSTAIPAAEAFKNNDQKRAANIFITGVMNDSLYFSKPPHRDQELILANTLETRGSAFTKNLFPAVSCDDLGKIKIPILLIAGDKSPLFLTLIIKELDRCLRNKKKQYFSIIRMV